MKIQKNAGWACVVIVSFCLHAFGQTLPNFTGINVTAENAVQLHWASDTNAVYEIDYADSLVDTNTGAITWNKLYDEYPSHGTNTFITDTGNYDSEPEITHPKNSPMRFYRVVLVQANDSPTNPTVSIISPTNGATLSDTVTIQVSASSPELLSDVKLYIDGEEQRPSDDNSNFVINTCEYLNGNHTLFATAASQSGLEGIPNGGVITYGRSVSPYINVTFDNLISEIAFSEPFFEPSLGQTQQVAAKFSANCDWTLTILDASSNAVRNVSGSGSSLSFDWDGTGDGETNIPDGVYNYQISAQTNGSSFMSMSSELSSSTLMSDEIMQLWALPEGSENPVPFAIYPEGFDTNNLTIFEATESEIQNLTMPSSTLQLTSSDITFESSYTGSSSQTTIAPKRKPNTGVKGSVGTFGICDKTYSTNGFSSLHPTTGWPYPLPTRVAIDGQSRTATSVFGRVREFHYIASEFDTEMKNAAWKRAFLKENEDWNANDIKKASLGGNSIFNTCNFGILMTHGSYGNNDTTGTESDGVKYTYLWFGGNDYLHLSDLDFGSSGTDGLRWMTLYCCSILKPENYDSMNSSGKIPVNENLHLLIGPSTISYANQGTGYDYAHNMTKNNQTIVDSFNNAMREENALDHMYIKESVLKTAVSYWPACLNDKLSVYNDPDPENGLQYQETQVYP